MFNVFKTVELKFGFDPKASLNSFGVFKASGAPAMMLVNLSFTSALVNVSALVA